MTTKELKQKYLKFFEQKGHKIIPGASLIPEHDPTVLFTTAGMHPLVPYLLGEKHPAGDKLVNNQKCIRTSDIDDVGDDVHLTFFEMLGNWALGSYWKKEAIGMSWEFLFDRKWLGLDKKKISASVFKGDPKNKIPKDNESAKIWQDLGISKNRIKFLGKDENFWGPAGKMGPCGPCTEMFYWTGKGEPPDLVTSDNKEGWVEIWNDVFMEYNKRQRTILADGINCLINKDLTLNDPLVKLLKQYNSRVIVVTNFEKTKIEKLVKDIGFELFTLEHRIEKNEPGYFRELLKEFRLSEEEVVYFEHNESSLSGGIKAGIISELYKNLDSLKIFLDKNIFYYVSLKQKNVDTGMGVERTVAVLNNKKSVFDIEPLASIVKRVKGLAAREDKRSERIIADHLRASCFILAEEVVPSNLERGYVLRRLIRRAIRYGKKIGIDKPFTHEIAKIIEVENKDFIIEQLIREEERFSKVLEKGLKEFEKGTDPFILFTTYGFPIEMTEELAKEKGIKIDKKKFEKEFKKHQELSQTATAGRFKSGLADHSEAVTKLHTATHLLLAALRQVLGEYVYQKGSNITAERLRLDFSHSEKMTPEQIKKVEDSVNEQIKKDLPIICEEMSLEEAKKSGAIGVFEARYGERVKVYSIGNPAEAGPPFSREICGGPHVKSTGELGHFKILKEESSSAGVRRIKAVMTKPAWSFN